MIARALRVAFAVGLVTLGLAPGALAQDQETVAAAAFDEGLQAYASRDYTTAARAFERAFAAAPRGSAAYNAGLAWDKLGDKERAADAYQLALEQHDLEATMDATSRERLAALKRVLAYVYVSSPVGAHVSVGRVESALVPVGIHLTPGSYAVRVELPRGGSDEKQLTLGAGQTERVAFAAPTSAEPPPASVAAPRGREGPRQPRAVDRRGADDPRPIIGGVLLGVAGVGAAVGIYFGVRTLSAKERYDSEQAQTGYYDADLYATARDLRTATNVSWIVAGASAIAGGAVLVSIAVSKRSSAVHPATRWSVAATKAGWIVRGNF